MGWDGSSKGSSQEDLDSKFSHCAAARPSFWKMLTSALQPKLDEYASFNYIGAPSPIRLAILHIVAPYLVNPVNYHEVYFLSSE
jgi:hypothetical protein